MTTLPVLAHNGRAAEDVGARVIAALACKMELRRGRGHGRRISTGGVCGRIQ